MNGTDLYNLENKIDEQTRTIVNSNRDLERAIREAKQPSSSSSIRWTKEDYKRFANIFLFLSVSQAVNYLFLGLFLFFKLQLIGAVISFIVQTILLVIYSNHKKKTWKRLSKFRLMILSILVYYLPLGTLLSCYKQLSNL